MIPTTPEDAARCKEIKKKLIELRPKYIRYKQIANGLQQGMDSADSPFAIAYSSQGGWYLLISKNENFSTRCGGNSIRIVAGRRQIQSFSTRLILFFFSFVLNKKIKRV